MGKKEQRNIASLTASFANASQFASTRQPKSRNHQN